VSIIAHPSSIFALCTPGSKWRQPFIILQFVIHQSANSMEVVVERQTEHCGQAGLNLSKSWF
jgi:hypothetical protein